MRSKYTLWKKYLLFTILKRTIQKSEHVEEVAAMLDCHPSAFVRECHIADEDSSNTVILDVQEDNNKIAEQLMRDIPEPCVRHALMTDFYCMDAGHRRIVEVFLTDAFFCDAILSFCGFASTILLHTKGASCYPIHTLVSAFNDRAIDFFCIQLDLQDVICFLEICDNILVNNNLSGTLDVHGWTYYLAIWAVIQGQCSFWNFE